MHFKQNTSKKYNYITKEGLDSLKKKLDRLTKNYMRSCQHLKKMDAKEKAEYIISNNEISNFQLHEKLIDDLVSFLKNARVIKRRLNKNNIELGSKVNLAFGGDSIDYMLVDPIEADPSANKISVKSPLGEALLGRRLNDTIFISTRKGGICNYKVLSVS